MNAPEIASVPNLSPQNNPDYVIVYTNSFWNVTDAYYTVDCAVPLAQGSNWYERSQIWSYRMTEL